MTNLIKQSQVSDRQLISWSEEKVQILQTRISLITSLIRRPFLLTTMAPVKNAHVIFNSVPEGQ
jgi:hypothetical protein